MSADELGTRLKQAAGKRFDVARYRCGLNPRLDSFPSRPSYEPTFFFRTEEIPSRVALLQSQLPHEAQAIVEQADEILDHRFRLLGYENLNYGPEIDWHLDTVHQKRAPVKPWHKIRFLDFNEVGDHKIIWELNRHQHLVTLAKAWCLTSNKTYIEELLKQWYSWEKANPYPLGINWASALEVAFRSLSWLWIRNLLAGCEQIPARFMSELTIALRQSGRYIERYHSKYFSPNTHLLGEAVALLYIGTLCPQLPEAPCWRRWGWNTVLHESHKQVRPDGVYFEQSLYYHVYASDFFLHARLLAARNGEVIPEKFDNTITRMLDFLSALSEGGVMEGFGDDDGGRVFNPRRNRVEHMSDPLAVGGIEYQNPNWRLRGGLTEEAIWLFGETAVASAVDESRARPNAEAFEKGGIYLIRDLEPVPQQMMIDAGPQGNANSGHGHADALSTRFSLHGHRCLIDPGSFVYVSSGDERNRFRGTGAHNTIRIDGVDQALPEGPFAWSSLPQVKTHDWINGETFNFFEGEHNGYCRLPDPVVHRRAVLHIKGEFWLVRDFLEGKGSHLIESFWHFGPHWRAYAQKKDLLVELTANAGQSHINLTLLNAQPSNWQTEIVTGEFSPSYGIKESAPVVRLQAEARLPASCTVLLAPMATHPGEFEEVSEGDTSGVYGYRFADAGSTHFIFFSDTTRIWKSGIWTSNARLLYARFDDGRLTRFALVGGSFVNRNETTLFSNPQPVERFEWVYLPDGVKTFSSQPVAGFATDNSLELLDPVH